MSAVASTPTTAPSEAKPPVPAIPTKERRWQRARSHSVAGESSSASPTASTASGDGKHSLVSVHVLVPPGRSRDRSLRRATAVTTTSETAPTSNGHGTPPVSASEGALSATSVAPLPDPAAFELGVAPPGVVVGVDDGGVV